MQIIGIHLPQKRCKIDKWTTRESTNEELSEDLTNCCMDGCYKRGDVLTRQVLLRTFKF